MGCRPRGRGPRPPLVGLQPLQEGLRRALRLVGRLLGPRRRPAPLPPARSGQLSARAYRRVMRLEAKTIGGETRYRLSPPRWLRSRETNAASFLGVAQE